MEQAHPRATRLAILALTAWTTACTEDTPPTTDPCEASVEAHEQAIDVPGRPKMDLLFVVDNSGSMCQEQRSLAQAFSPVARELFIDPGGAGIDARIAVTSTDLKNDGQRGAFQNTPADPRPALNCFDPATGEPATPNTADCPANLPIILSSRRDGSPVDAETFDRDFRCHVTLGTDGDGFENGLEAMRLSLSCTGPNAAIFGDCCVGGERDVACASSGDGGVEPEFLRPDAALVVVFVSDEDDCSDPVANPAASRLAICKYGPRDDDGDGVPDGYRDARLCQGDPAACFRGDCGELAAEECHAQRCFIPRSANSNCAWLRDHLTPVEDYRDFLVGLKRGAAARVVVFALVGTAAYTESGDEISYNLPAHPSDPECDPDADEFNPDKPLDVCCPEGRCEGRIRPSCASGLGQAFDGSRYRRLAELFGDDGLAESICVDSLQGPLDRLRGAVTETPNRYCLEAPPACRMAGRACSSPEERANPSNYAVRITVECPAGECEAGESPTGVLGSDAWSLEPAAPGCASGAAVTLVNPPPRGGRIVLSYSVAGAACDAGAPDGGT